MQSRTKPSVKRHARVAVDGLGRQRQPERQGLSDLVIYAVIRMIWAATMRMANALPDCNTKFKKASVSVLYTFPKFSRCLVEKGNL